MDFADKLLTRTERKWCCMVYLPLALSTVKHPFQGYDQKVGRIELMLVNISLIWYRFSWLSSHTSKRKAANWPLVLYSYPTLEPRNENSAVVLAVYCIESLVIRIEQKDKTAFDVLGLRVNIHFLNDYNTFIAGELLDSDIFPDILLGDNLFLKESRGAFGEAVGTFFLPALVRLQVVA